MSPEISDWAAGGLKCLNKPPAQKGRLCFGGGKSLFLGTTQRQNWRRSLRHPLWLPPANQSKLIRYRPVKRPYGKMPAAASKAGRTIWKDAHLERPHQAEDLPTLTFPVWSYLI
jgi:hypothetical protein